MTTFLLHGGATSKDNKDNDEFFRQFTTLVDKQTVKILLCYWSREKSQWDVLAKRDASKILKNTSKLVELYVLQNTKDLFSKLPEFDVLYVAGGEAKPIEPLYPALEDLKEALKGKIYAGSSMGAFLVSEQYVLSFDSQDSDTVHKGLGLIPMQILCHWNIETKKQEKLKLLETHSDLPVLVLEESKFVTIYQ